MESRLAEKNFTVSRERILFSGKVDSKEYVMDELRNKSSINESNQQVQENLNSHA